MTTSPKVSIVTISYNQEQYIKDALDSFVNQEVDFDIEIIIADDASSDQTPQIIAEYAKQYPKIFKPILRKKNIGAVANSLDALRAASGQYIALCEGDDFWTDPHKLQRQVDFLDSNKGYTICFHPVKVFFQNGKEKDAFYPGPEITSRSDWGLDLLLERNFIPTNSVMYRRQEIKNVPLDIMPLDWFLHITHAKNGKIGMLNEVMASYRRHNQGMWWDSHEDMDKLWVKHGKAYIRLFVAVIRLFEGDTKRLNIIEGSLTRLLTALIQVDIKNNVGLLKQATKDYPALGQILTSLLLDELRDKEAEIKDKQNEIAVLEKRCADLEGRLVASQGEVAALQSELTNRKTEIKRIKSSKLWKIRHFLTKVHSMGAGLIALSIRKK